MPRFVYDALDPKGRVVHGVIDAPSEKAVVRDLQTIRYTVTNIRQQEDILYGLKRLTARFQRVGIHTLAVFTRQFATIFNSGIPLMYGLEGMMNLRQTENKKLAAVMGEVYKDVRAGYSLARALSKHSEVFSPVYISLVRAGEVSGALGEILERLAGFMEKEYLIQKKVQTAPTYPAVVFFFALGVTTLLVTYIFPSFISLFEGLEVNLPITTRFIMALTKIIKNPGFLLSILVSLLVFWYVLKQYFRTGMGKRQLDYILLEIPLAGHLFRKLAISRFCRTLGTLLASGVNMLRALEVVEKVTGNEVFAETIYEIRIGLKAGMRLSQPLKEYALFPPMVANMVAIGEEGGNLPLILQKIAYFYEVELDHTLNTLTSLLEPILIGIMGVIVGIILLGIFQPIYELLQKF